MDGVVSHCKWYRPLWLGLYMRLCVCVVIFWLYNVLLVLSWVQRPNPGEKEENTVQFNKYMNVNFL